MKGLWEIWVGCALMTLLTLAKMGQTNTITSEKLITRHWGSTTVMSATSLLQLRVVWWCGLMATGRGTATPTTCGDNSELALGLWAAKNRLISGSTTRRSNYTIEESLTLHRRVEAGLIRFVGVSNFSVEQLSAMLWFVPSRTSLTLGTGSLPMSMAFWSTARMKFDVPAWSW